MGERSWTLTVTRCTRSRRSTTRADIERLAVQLEQERTTRQQKEQYSALARCATLPAPFAGVGRGPERARPRHPARRPVRRPARPRARFAPRAKPHAHPPAAPPRRINAYPARDATEAEIQRLNAEIASLKQEGDAVASALDLRSKRFAGFMHALHDMELLLATEAAPAGTAE